MMENTELLGIMLPRRTKALLRLRAMRREMGMSDLAREVLTKWLGDPLPEEMIFIDSNGTENVQTGNID